MILAGYLGGTRNPMGVRWPAKIKPDATPRSQFHHVNDIVPTIYEILGITPPPEVNGVSQDSIDGVSLAYTFDDPTAEGRLVTQYFETLGCRGIYHKGWMASAFGPRVPWVTGLPPGIFEIGRRTTTRGSCTTSTRTGARPTTSLRRCRRSWPR